MRKTLIGLTTFVTGMACAAAASAGDYKVTTIDANGAFAGCLALNEPAGVGFVAVGSSVAVLTNSPKLAVAKGDDVKGSWSVDGGAKTEFSGKADRANVATIDVPNSPEAVTALTTGKRLDVMANGSEASFELGGSGQAFSDLIQCMTNQKAP